MREETPLGNVEPPAGCSSPGEHSPYPALQSGPWAPTDLTSVSNYYYELHDLEGSNCFSFVPSCDWRVTDVLGTVPWARDCRGDRKFHPSRSSQLSRESKHLNQSVWCGVINVSTGGDDGWGGELCVGGIIHFEPQFSHLRNRDNNAHFIWWLG